MHLPALPAHHRSPQWSCMAWDDMMASLKSRDGRCDIAVAGVEVSPEELGDGIVFTRRSTENGLSVLVRGLAGGGEGCAPLPSSKWPPIGMVVGGLSQTELLPCSSLTAAASHAPG